MPVGEATGPGSGAARHGHTVALQNLLRPPLVSGDIAVKLAELLLRSRWEEGTVRRQLPLAVEDRGACWRVVGADHAGSGDPDRRFCLLLRKADGLILEIGIFSGPGGLPDV